MANELERSELERSELSAKVVVLGDASTGKSSIVKSIIRTGQGEKPKSSVGKQESIFTHTMVHGGSGKNKTRVHLKIWEYSTKQSREESEIILRNALFCIITFDLRSPESANSAFNNWLTLRDKFMPESFLFVIGSHLDMVTSRRVEAAELCKACAQNDAMYMEVSNSDATNLALVWRIMSQRLNMMVDVREKIHEEAKEGLHPALDSDDEDIDPSAEQEWKIKRRRDKFASMLESEVLDTKFLEGEVLCESVGSILSSTLGVDYWPGYVDQEKDLREVGDTIVGNVRSIALDPSSAPKTPVEFALESVPSVPNSDDVDNAPETSPEELQRAFSIMNFQIPSTLLTFKEEGKLVSRGLYSAEPSQRSSTESGRASAPALKVNVCLPSGLNTDMTIYPGYHLGKQVEAFLLQHNMEKDDNARHKLMNVAAQLAQRYFASHKPPMPPAASQKR